MRIAYTGIILRQAEKGANERKSTEEDRKGAQGKDATGGRAETGANADGARDAAA